MKTMRLGVVLLFACGGELQQPEAAGESDELALSEAALCSVVQKELIATQLAVVEDPVRTTWAQDPATNPKAAAWTFGRLMQQMAGTHEPSAFTEALFSKWLTDQTVNGFTVRARPAIKTLVLERWPRVEGKLDLKKAPLRLLAIVNRMDLRKLSQGNAGEGRFVFGVLSPDGGSTSFTVILEYKLPAATRADVLGWANGWHKLAGLTGAAYNDQLQLLTDKFAGAGAGGSRPNGSSIGQIRTNEIALAGPWELREFKLNAAGDIVEVTTANQPAAQFNGTGKLARWVNANEAKLVAGTAVVPLQFEDAPFRAGAIPNNIDFWSAGAITNNEARHALSVNTCNGCHGRETNTSFLQIGVRSAGFRSTLSGFMTGIDVVDPVRSGKTRRFDDLKRRANDLTKLVCPAGALAAEAFEVEAERVH